MKKTLLLISTKAITLNNFFDEFIKDKKFNLILGCSDTENLNFNKKKIKLYFDSKFLDIINPISFISKLIKNYLILRKINFDYVLINTPLAALYMRLILFFLKKKTIYLVHGYRFHKSEKNLKSFFFFIYEKIYSYLTKYYIVLNKEDYKLTINKFKKNKNRILKLPSIGIDYKKLKKLKYVNCNDIFNIGVISAYRNNKGYPHLIKIADNFQKKKLNIRFNCYGYDDKNNYQKKIKKLNLKNIILNDYNNKIFNKIKNFDLVCHLSRREGVPISLLETLTIGVPVIAYNIRGNNDIIRNNFNGILIKPYDIHSFQLKLINLSQNLKKLKFLRKNCKKSINILHDKKNITLMINRFIENVR